MLTSVHVVAEPDAPELARVERQPRAADALDEPLGPAPVRDQISDRQHRQPVPTGELDELGKSCHGAVVGRDLAYDGCRRETGHIGQVDRRLGVPSAFEHAATLIRQWEHVPRLDQTPRIGTLLREGTNRQGSVAGRDPSRAFSVVDTHVEGSPMRVATASDHRRYSQCLETLRKHGNADQAAAMGGHEIDRVRRDVLGRHDEVALVLPVRGVDDHDHLAVGDGGDGVLHARQPPEARRPSTRELRNDRGGNHLLVLSRRTLASPPTPSGLPTQTRSHAPESVTRT